MDKHDKIPIKMFNETNFSIWKYHMEMIFKAKKALHVINGLKKQLVIETLHASFHDQVLFDTWYEKNENARMFTSKSISQKILGKLTRCGNNVDKIMFTLLEENIK